MMTIPPSKMGYIIETVHTNPVDSRLEIRDYSFEGGPYFEIDHTMLRRRADINRTGDVVSIGPYRLLVIDHDYSVRRVTCILDTGWIAHLRAWGHRHAYILRLVKSRLIITCAVWGLADYCGEMNIPEWSDIRLVRRLRRNR